MRERRGSPDGIETSNSRKSERFSTGAYFLYVTEKTRRLTPKCEVYMLVSRGFLRFAHLKARFGRNDRK